MAVGIRARVVEVGGPSALLRKWPKAAKAAMQAGADLWHRQFLPEHFKPYAGPRYGYKRRTEKYERRKQRIWGHKTPLRYSGRLEEWVRRMHRVTGTRSRVTVHLRAPWYVQTYRTRPTMPDMGSELVATTPAEIRGIQKEIDAAATRELRAVRDRETVKT